MSGNEEDLVDKALEIERKARARDALLLKAQELAQLKILNASPSFKLATIEELREVCNGCGSSQAKFDFVPDTIYGTYIGEACQIHDWDYNEGLTNEDKEEADRRMKNNILRLLRRRDKWYKPSWFQRIRTQLYFKTVDWFGGEAFWANKD